MSQLQHPISLDRGALADFLIRLSLDASLQDDFLKDSETTMARTGMSATERELFRSKSTSAIFQAFSGEDPLAPIPTIAIVIVNATRCF
jgi:hypothetical protein